METLILSPDFIFEENIRHSTLVSNFENGAEQRRAKWASPKRFFKLNYKYRSKVDYETMRTFVLARSGSYDSFLWVNRADGNTYAVRFLDDGFKVVETDYHKYSFTVTLKEV